jgi:hypothetical protein
VQKLRPSLGSLLFQAIVAMQAAEDQASVRRGSSKHTFLLLFLWHYGAVPL